MKLRTYIILAVVAFLAVALWLLPQDTGPLLFVAACAFVVFAFYYTIARLFWAVINRLERR